MIYEHSKPLYGAGYPRSGWMTAIIQYSGAPLGHLTDWKDANIEVCFFVPGIYTPIAYHRHKDRVPLKEVDPIAISEVLSDLTVLAAKAP